MTSFANSHVRVLRYATSLLLLSTGILKFLPSGDHEIRATWFQTMLYSIAVTELAIAIGLQVTRSVRAASIALCLLSIAFGVWLLIAGSRAGVGTPTCGCFGPLRASFSVRLSLAGLFEVLGVFCLATANVEEVGRAASDGVADLRATFESVPGARKRRR